MNTIVLGPRRFWIAVLEALVALLSTWGVLMLIAVAVTMLSACATDGQTVAIVDHTTSIAVSVPDEVRCFRKADIPVMPGVVHADTATAAPHQLAEASAVNAEAWIRYGRAMAKQFRQCEDSAPEAAPTQGKP